MNNFGRCSQFRLIIHLFYEGKTELDYLQKFIRQQNKNTLVRLNKILINPNPLTLAQKSVEQFDDLKMNNSEVWVLFDHDGRDVEVKDAIDYIIRSGKHIGIAFMKPCIEI